MTTRDRLLVAAIAIVAVLIAAPGVHLFELWMPPLAATIVSHGLAVLGIAIAVREWRRRRRFAR